MDDLQVRARREIEAVFRDRIDRDIELIAEQHCHSLGLADIAPRCRSTDAILSDMIWSRFGAFDWSTVAFIYDGTYGHHSRYLWAKVELTVAWARTGGFGPDVEAALVVATRRLRELWVEWAGYQATKRDDLALAVGT